MESITDNAPLVAIVGQTASGKTALALQIAQQFNGEIIAADSRTVYKRMDIGTAKPSVAEQQLVPHHLLDVVYPDERFTVADFQVLAQKAIKDIRSRGRLPIIVGGSGLYIDAVLYGFSFRPEALGVDRAVLSQLSVNQLQQLCRERGLALPANANNPRHLVRTIETNGVLPQKKSLRARTTIIGLQLDTEILHHRIRQRVDDMVTADLVNEVRALAQDYGWDAPALQAPAYRAFRDYIQGLSSLDEAKRLFVQKDKQYAKRQKTWFKRNKDIHWISKPEQAVEIITSELNNIL